LDQPKYLKNDPTYLGSSGYDNPKEYFKLLVEVIKARPDSKGISLLDVGCASGAFMSYAIEQLPITKCVGIDISEDLIHQGREYVPDAEFIHGSIEDLNSVASETYDVVTCLGTLGIFSDIEPHIKSLLATVKPGGMLLIFDAFNRYPIDVQALYRTSEESAKAGPWQSALNTFSIATYERILASANNGGQHTWVDFNMPFPIPETENPMRAWTINTDVKQNQVVVGTGQYLDQKILTITKKQ
jgi:ubiquinone/menaquinone biosynthesis C-methylase UbiE